MNSARIIKSIAIVCFTLLAVAIIIAINSPTHGYEMSIYRVTPAVVWVTIILSILSGLGIVLHQLYRQQENRSRLWIIGLSLIASGFIILVSVHIFRGYPFYGRADSTTHLATVSDLLQNGHTARGNFYPLTHIYITQLVQIWDVPLTKLFSTLPVFFNVMYMMFIYFFARTVLSQNGRVILATVAGIYLVSAVGFGWVYTSPNELADSLVPLVFMFSLRRLAGDDSLKVQITILFLIMVFLLPPIHPVPTFALLLTLASLWLPMKLYNTLGRDRVRPVAEYRFVVPAAVILFVWGISWLSSFYVWESIVRNVYISLTKGGPTWASQLEDQMLLATTYGYSVVEQFLKTYICPLTYAILTVISFPIILSRVSRERGLEKLLSLYGPLLVLAIFFLLFYSLYIGFGPGRVIRYALILSVPCVGYVIYEMLLHFLRSRLWAKVGLSVVVVLLALITVNSVFIAYSSPYRLLPNDQPTLAEPDGTGWLNTHHSGSLGLVRLTLPVERLVVLLPTADWMMNDILLVPYHFNYPEQGMLGNSYSKDKYLALTTTDRAFYVDLFSMMAPYRFYPSDFDRLESDPSLDKIYFNRGMEIWYVRALM